MKYLKEIYKIKTEDFEEDSYLRNIPSLKNFQGLKIEKPVTFFVGENGSGKSTLLEAIAVALGLNPEGGSKNFNFFTKETHSELGKLLEIARGPRREEDGFFLEPNPFITWQQKLNNLQPLQSLASQVFMTLMVESHFMTNHTERVLGP